MKGSIVIQSLGKVKKATALSFIRQIILFIPISLFLGIALNNGIYGILYAGAIADVLSFIVAIIIFASEYRNLDKRSDVKDVVVDSEVNDFGNFNKIITISREYGSGGRFVAKVLGERLGLKVYDAELIRLAAKESGFSYDYVEKNEQSKGNFYENDDRMFIDDKKVIKRLAKSPCIIVGRCADYILGNQENVVKIFLYSDDAGKMHRAIKYYGLSEEKAKREIKRINKMRAKHYKYYTNREWTELSNYDALFNVDKSGIDGTVENIIKFVDKSS